VELQRLAEVIDHKVLPHPFDDERNRAGQFIKGHSGPGRPIGSKPKLAEAFIRDVYTDWQEHGPDVLARVRSEQPAMYLRVVASMIPAQLQVQVVDSFEAMALQDLRSFIAQEVRGLGLTATVIDQECAAHGITEAPAGKPEETAR
jgi:hypothetical protein